VQKFPARGASAPDHELVATLLFRLVEAADEGGEDVAVLGMEVVTGAVEASRHDGAVVDPVLPVVALAQLDGGYLGDGVGLVGGLERAREKRVLGHRLGRELRIIARGAELKLVEIIRFT